MESNHLQEYEIDEIIERVKERREEINRLTRIAEERKSKIDYELSQKVEKLEKQIKWDLELARQSAEAIGNLKETKTQFKATFLSGDLIIKKPKVSIAKPKKDIYDQLFELYPEYKKVKEVEELDWKELKSKLKVIDGRVFDIETGEDVSKYFEVEEKGEEIDVK